MAATQQSVEMTSSQLTQVAVGDTKPPQSAQKTQIDPTNDSSIARAQNTTQNAPDNPFDENNKSSGDLPSFTASLHQYSRKLDHDFDGFQESIEKADPPTESIEDFDWEELENAYQKEVGDIVMRERDIMSQFDARFKVCSCIHARIPLTSKQFMLWMQVSDERENQRAIKR